MRFEFYCFKTYFYQIHGAECTASLTNDLAPKNYNSSVSTSPRVTNPRYLMRSEWPVFGETVVVITT